MKHVPHADRISRGALGKKMPQYRALLDEVLPELVSAGLLSVEKDRYP